MMDIASSGECERGVTWREMLGFVEVRSHVLRPFSANGGSVVIAIASGIDLAAWIGGGVHAGARVVLMHPRSGPAEVASVVRKTGANAIIAENSLTSAVDASVARCRATEHSLAQAVEAIQAQATGVRCEGLEASHPASQRTDATSRGGSVVLSSSGTTGLPKLVIRGEDALDADARQVTEGLGLCAGDRVLCVPPLCHSYGVDLLFGSWLTGSCLCVMREYDVTGAAAQLMGGVTVLPGVPFVFESLARSPSRAPRLRIAVSAGSMLSPRVRDEFMSAWGVSAGQLYGASELGTVAVHVSPSEPFSIGRGLTGVSLRVVDRGDPSREVPIGVEGELIVRAPSMLDGCVEGEVDRVDGHVRMGDLAVKDSAGNVTIMGRLKLLIDSGGFKVNPLEVESVLLEHSAVADCAVTAMDLSDTIQRVCAFVVAKDVARPPSERALRSFLLERLAPAKVPRRIAFVDALPRSPLGKLLRDRLPRAWSER
jgi:long-chain acyl-CoA synthetase